MLFLFNSIKYTNQEIKELPTSRSLSSDQRRLLLVARKAYAPNKTSLRWSEHAQKGQRTLETLISSSFNCISHR
jgi:hypothetical protein